MKRLILLFVPFMAAFSCSTAPEYVQLWDGTLRPLPSGVNLWKGVSGYGKGQDTKSKAPKIRTAAVPYVL